MTSANSGEVHVYPTTTTGRVIEVHHERRDRGLLSFPCYRTDARFDPGMSGGPVFDEQGGLCGMICSNTPPLEDAGEQVSYVSTLWPLLGVYTDLPWERYPPGTKYPLYRYAQEKIIRAKDLELFEFVEDSSGTAGRVLFRAQS